MLSIHGFSAIVSSLFFMPSSLAVSFSLLYFFCLAHFWYILDFFTFSFGTCLCFLELLACLRTFWFGLVLFGTRSKILSTIFSRFSLNGIQLLKKKKQIQYVELIPSAGYDSW